MAEETAQTKRPLESSDRGLPTFVFDDVFEQRRPRLVLPRPAQPPQLKELTLLKGMAESNKQRIRQVISTIPIAFTRKLVPFPTAEPPE